MPADVVVDASVLAAIFLREPGAPALAACLREVRRLRTAPHARHEVANALWRRRASLTPAHLDERVRTVFEFPMDDAFDAAHASRAMALAVGAGLTFYDAAYVAVAERAAVPLWTLDERQRDAARQAGVAVTSDGCHVLGGRG